MYVRTKHHCLLSSVLSYFRNLRLVAGFTKMLADIIAHYLTRNISLPIQKQKESVFKCNEILSKATALNFISN